MLKITVEFGGKILHTITTDKPEVFIGRNEDNDVRIDNLAVSGRHARIFREKDAYVLEDLNSTNGTFINDRKISKQTVKDTHRIVIGKHNLSVHNPDAKSKVPDFVETVKVDIRSQKG